MPEVCQDVPRCADFTTEHTLIGIPCGSQYEDFSSVRIAWPHQRKLFGKQVVLTGKNLLGRWKVGPVAGRGNGFGRCAEESQRGERHENCNCTLHGTKTCEGEEGGRHRRCKKYHMQLSVWGSYRAGQNNDLPEHDRPTKPDGAGRKSIMTQDAGDDQDQARKNRGATPYGKRRCADRDGDEKNRDRRNGEGHDHVAGVGMELGQTDAGEKRANCRRGVVDNTLQQAGRCLVLHGGEDKRKIAFNANAVLRVGFSLFQVGQTCHTLALCA